MVQRPLFRLQIVPLPSEGIGLFALDWREVPQRGFEDGQMNYAEAEMSSVLAKKRFHLGSLEKIIHVSTCSVTQLSCFLLISPVKERRQIH